jgi:3'-5' exoribonuclease
MNIQSLRSATRDGAIFFGVIEVQIESLHLKETAAGKPFYELLLRDATDSLILRAWSDKPAFTTCQKIGTGTFVKISGNFTHGSFGLDAPGWNMEPLSEEEITLLLEGSIEQQAAHDAAFQILLDAVSSIIDPRLQSLCDSFLTQHGARFRRAAAARTNHHARRGGLLDHTARMMQSFLTLRNVYPELNHDLLITGILFHDCGKLWETCPPAEGFGIIPDLRGELMGHLSIGVELVNALWRELPKEEWSDLVPSSEEVRLHLLHLIASHHGQLEYGSPILPKTPEAITLHLLDNLDARLEMFQEAYSRSSPSELGLFEWSRPLGVAPIAPLKKYLPQEEN